MKLLTKEIANKLPALYSQDNVADPVCVLKYFLQGWTWYICEGGKQENGDWLFFGKVVSPLCPEGELGYVLLSELERVRGGVGLGVERDLYWKDTPLSQCK